MNRVNRTVLDYRLHRVGQQQTSADQRLIAYSRCSMW